MTRSQAPEAPSDVVKPESRSRRVFGRDITNATTAAPTTASLNKPVVFSMPGAQQAAMEVNPAFAGRDYMQRPADDIDSRDMGNPLLATTYVNEMYDNFAVLEREIQVNSNYMKETQAHISEKMRAILVDWMVEVHIKFKQVPETLYLTIQLIDRFLELKSVRRSKLQLVGVACLFVSD
mgnify:CR=1 FL=1